MIVDVHTHIFPPRMIAQRMRLAEADPGFGELYAHPKAKMATGEQLIASMDTAGVDVAVACGFWWRSAEQAAEHRAYLLDVAAQSGGRIVAFVPVAADEGAEAIDDAATAGARGVGEMRPGDEADASAREIVGRAAARGLAVLVHCSEDVGHLYPGKRGGLTPGGLWRLASARPQARLIAAHWGGGFPFYALMPEVCALIEGGRLAFDSAATPLLYEPRVFEAARALLGDGAVLWGSDFPLRDQRGDRAAVEAAVTAPEARAAILGGNAVRLLGL